MVASVPSVSPGEILLEEFLKPLELSQYRLAKDIGVPPRRINEIVHGKRAITADTALRLSRYFGNSSEFWLNLQARYDLERERERLGERLEGSVRVAPVSLDVDVSRLAEVCRRRGITRLRLFGSHARGDATAASDVDVIADFGKPTGLFELVRAERELSQAIGRKVDLLTEGAISPYMKPQVLREARAIYEAGS